jgi:hypothetical protein
MGERWELIKRMLQARRIALVYGKPGTTNHKAAKHYHGYYADRDHFRRLSQANRAEFYRLKGEKK